MGPKHFAFNDQETNRYGVATFFNEQSAREIYLKVFEIGVREGNMNGLMSSFNRIGCTWTGRHHGLLTDILRNEWGFKGYNVTDFTGVSLKAAPKESILAGTTAFCGFGSPNLSYWTKETELLSKDKDICAAIKQNIKYVLYSLANSNALNGINSSSHVVWLMTSWRAMYISFISISGVALLGLYGSYIVLSLRNKKEEE